MRKGFFLFASLAIPFAATLLATREAHAEDLIKIGAGLMGGVGVNGQSKPDNTTLPDGRIDPTYPGFFGATGGGGLMLDARLLGIVGLEVDLLYQNDRGNGDLTVGGTKFDIGIGQKALHVPVLLKGVIPLGIARPFAVFGPEFVFPGTSSASVSPEGRLGTTINAQAGSYTMLTAGLGLEIKLPIPVIDLRIPFSIRGSLNPGTSDKIAERRDVQLNGNTIVSTTYKSEWQYQGMATVGAALYF